MKYKFLTAFALFALISYMGLSQATYTVTQNKALSTSYEDFAPRYLDETGQTMIFTSDRGSSMGLQNIYYTTSTNGKWSTPMALITNDNQNCNYGVVSIDTKRKVLFFTRCDIVKNVHRKCRIYYSFMRGDLIGEQFPLEIAGNSDTEGDQDYTFGHPYYSDKMHVLFFVSDMPGGYGRHDIWFSKYDTANDSWAANQNAGQEVNSAGSELFPSVSDDGTLYFTSDGHGGFGGEDIFRAQKTGDLKWGNVENMGEPINSDSDDCAIVFKPGTNTGYVTSRRKGGLGTDDIYDFSLIEKTQPEVATISQVKKDSMFKTEKKALTEIFNHQSCNAQTDSLNITVVKVYPNPNRGEFTYEFNSNKNTNLTLRIFSSLGKVVSTEQLNVSEGKFSKQYDLSGQSKGIYYVQLLFGCEPVSTVKVVVI